ncbi:MAG: T9SS type A sorting domain-containing protein [Saprospiraceae bacterium]|nr:T9SS type A sorting domain-containing protein [Saprospiraceae bacterium]
MKYPLLLSLWIAITATTGAQTFEYAMTQPEYVGSEINQIVPTQERIYLAGGQSWCHQPAIWIFDTTGQLLTVRQFSVDNTYGTISQLLVDSLTGDLTALLNIKVKYQAGANKVKILRLNPDLEIIDEYTFEDHLTDQFAQSAFLTDSSLYLLTGSNLSIFNEDFLKVKDVNLPVTIENEATLLLKDHHLLFYDNQIHNTIFTLDMAANGLSSIKTDPFDELVIFKDFIFIGHENVIDKYDLFQLNQVDRQIFPLYESLELVVINEGFLQIIGHLVNGMTYINYFTEELKNALPEQIRPLYEKNFTGAIDQNRELYQTSSYRKQWPQKNTDFPSADFIPVLRKKHIAFPFSIERPSLEITDVEITNKLQPFHCDTTYAAKPFCVYSGEYLHYKITVKNTGMIPIQNFAYYSNNVDNLLCYSYNGYHYVDDLNLQPGTSMTMEDSMQLHVLLNYPNLEFYAVAPNHLTSDIPTSTFSIENATTGSLLINAPESIYIYPNPTSDYIYIDDNKLNGHTYEVVDWAGKIIQQGTINNAQIDVSQLSTAPYSIKIKNQRKLFVGHFIKN